MGPDLNDKRWIIAKGILFLVLAAFSGVLQLLADLPIWQEAVLLGLCVWSACRFYYFLFHVLHAYIGIPSAGLLDLLKHLRIPPTPSAASKNSPGLDHTPSDDSKSPPEPAK